LRHIDQVKIPVFVTHGKDDFIAQTSQSRRLVDELEKYHVPYEKLFIGGEGHGFSYYKNRMKVYAEIAAFLEKNLRPLPSDPAPAAPAR
jgi:dipeptidyl aminopeptidase/acylaminoacyl peptidase